MFDRDFGRPFGPNIFPFELYPDLSVRAMYGRSFGPAIRISIRSVSESVCTNLLSPLLTLRAYKRYSALHRAAPCLTLLSEFGDPSKHVWEQIMRALLWLGMIVLTGVTLNAAEPAAKESAAKEPAAKEPASKEAESKATPTPAKPELKDFNGYFPWTPPADKAAWETRRVELLRQLQLAVGLYPMPDRSAAPKATIHGPVDRPEYTVERVAVETLPGHYLTGSLYRPKNASGKLPAILTPHGHWNQGRFHSENDAGMKKELASGGEQFDIGGRHPLQACAVHLVRSGYVVFLYDMLGYADSQVVSYDIAHRFMKRRPQMERDDHYGFFSPQAEARLESVMGLQTWNTFRAFDWIASLPDVDASRIGITGASGGGTQSFIAAALEPRIAAAFPAVMVSTAMQGGCTCENCNYLRVDTGNIELAALIAPRPLGMTTANDWTKELLTKGYPSLQALYKLYGVEDRVSVHSGTQFPHNYNSPSRAAMVAFFQKYLQPDSKIDTAERDYQPLTIKEATVWDADHPAPKTGEEAEVALLRAMQEQGEAAVKGAKPEEIAAAFRTMVGDHSQALSRLPIPSAEVVEYLKDKTTIMNIVAAQEQDDSPKDLTYGLLASKYALSDSYMKGDAANYVSPWRVKNDRDYAGFTYGYNHSIFAHRAGKLANRIWQIKKLVGDKESLILRAEPGVEHWALAAALVAGDKLTAIDLRSTDFRFSKLSAWDDADFWPGAVKYGDLPGLLRCQTVPVLIARSEAAEKLVNEIKHRGLRVEFYDPTKPKEYLQALERVQKQK
jgi:dienelactone hydrolase